MQWLHNISALKNLRNLNYTYSQRKCNCEPTTCEASNAYLNQLDEVFKYSLPKGGKVAAFFAESIQVCEKKTNYFLLFFSFIFLFFAFCYTSVSQKEVCK